MPVEEKEVLVQQAPCSAEGSPTLTGHRKLTKIAAAFALSAAVIGSAIAFTHRASFASTLPAALQPSALWSTEDKVPCGFGKECTCEWASADKCGRQDEPRTPCWSCCCNRIFPDAYRWAVARDYPNAGGGLPWPEDTEDDDGGRGECEEFHHGQAANVQSAYGHWHPATILERVSTGRYQVQYDLSRRVEIVRCEEMMEAVWTPWWVWLFWLCAIVGIGMCVAGLFGYYQKRGTGFAFLPPASAP